MKYITHWLQPIVFVLVMGTFVESALDHSLFLDSKENVQLHWTVKRAEKKIVFSLQVNSTGWIAFGISKGLSGKMLDSDIVVGWVDSKGNGYLKDYHGVGNKPPVLDTTSNYKLLKAEEKNSQTILQFERDLNTCDKEHDQDIKEGTTKVLWAHSRDNTDPQTPEDGPTYHFSNRGSRSVNLLNYVKNSPVPAHAKSFDILQEDVTVSSHHTTYFCRAFKMPELSKKHQIIEIAPIVVQGNEGLVHHIVIYECGNGFNETFLNHSGPCRSPLMPVDLRKCVGGSALFAWAIGGTNFKFPDKAGIPLGSANGIKYIVMETHYDNPQQKTGLRDSSGLRFYYTDKLRQYDAATLMTGYSVNTNLLIPPRQENFVTTGYCGSNVTEKPGIMITSFPENAIKIFAVFPHAHLAGRALWLQHVQNNGTELPEILRDDNYDFNYQQTHILPNEVDFKQGETLISNCRYNTMNKDYATVGGESTREEMCLFFILYYPKQKNFHSCLSQTDLKSVALKYANYSKGFRMWDNVAWNSSMKEELNKVYERKKILQYVQAVDSKFMAWTYGDAQTVKVPYKRPQVCVAKGGPPNKGNIIKMEQALSIIYFLAIMIISLL